MKGVSAPARNGGSASIHHATQALQATTEQDSEELYWDINLYSHGTRFRLSSTRTVHDMDDCSMVRTDNGAIVRTDNGAVPYPTLRGNDVEFSATVPRQRNPASRYTVTLRHGL